MNNTFELTAGELTSIRYVAWKSASKWSLVEVDDLESELILWAYENRAAIIRYRSDSEGPAKLLVALRRRANQACVKEQAERSGMPLDYNMKYSIQQIENALVAMFNTSNTHGSRVHPSSGMMIDRYDPFIDEAKTAVLDTRRAFDDLEPDLQKLLIMKYEKQYTFRDIAVLEGISAPGVRKRIRKALRKMQGFLGSN